jgi:hypothetical protein
MGVEVRTDLDVPHVLAPAKRRTLVADMTPIAGVVSHRTH